MNFEPPKFFIGLMEFFSILLPGALLTYFFKDEVGPHLLGNRYLMLKETEGAILFLFSSYLFGHFIFLLGACALDEYLYDPIRKGTGGEQAKRLAEDKELSFLLTRLAASLLIRKGADDAVNQAVAIKEHYLNPLGAKSAVNAFQWCKARLALKHCEAMATVQRFEADSKFFRSFVIVLPILIVFRSDSLLVAIAGEVLLLLAFWRYVDQRVKATSQAYWYVITVEGQAKGGYRYVPPDPATGPTHAGGVVYRQIGERVEYLLVRATKAPNEWVLPKGHIEPAEPIRQTAIREVREETGVWAAIVSELDRSSYSIEGKNVVVQFYLMKALEEGQPVDANRKHRWLSLEDAAALLKSIPDSNKSLKTNLERLLTLADKKRTSINPLIDLE